MHGVLLALVLLLSACSDSSEDPQPQSLTWDDTETTWDNDNWE